MALFFTDSLKISIETQLFDTEELRTGIPYLSYNRNNYNIYNGNSENPTGQQK
jgi:hypothetical protein